MQAQHIPIFQPSLPFLLLRISRLSLYLCVCVSLSLSLSPHTHTSHASTDSTKAPVVHLPQLAAAAAGVTVVTADTPEDTALEGCRGMVLSAHLHHANTPLVLERGSERERERVRNSVACFTFRNTTSHKYTRTIQHTVQTGITNM